MEDRALQGKALPGAEGREHLHMMLIKGTLIQRGNTNVQMGWQRRMRGVGWVASDDSEGRVNGDYILGNVDQDQLWTGGKC